MNLKDIRAKIITHFTGKSKSPKAEKKNLYYYPIRRIFPFQPPSKNPFNSHFVKLQEGFNHHHGAFIPPVSWGKVRGDGCGKKVD